MFLPRSQRAQTFRLFSRRDGSTSVWNSNCRGTRFSSPGFRPTIRSSPVKPNCRNSCPAKWKRSNTSRSIQPCWSTTVLDYSAYSKNPVGYSYMIVTALSRRRLSRQWIDIPVTNREIVSRRSPNTWHCWTRCDFPQLDAVHTMWLQLGLQPSNLIAILPILQFTICMPSGTS